MRPQPLTIIFGQVRNTESRRNNLTYGRAQNWLYNDKCTIQTEQVVFMCLETHTQTQTHTHTDTHTSDNEN